MTRKVHDHIRHSGRTLPSRKNEQRDALLDMEGLPLENYEFSLTDIKNDFLSLAMDEDQELKTYLTAAYHILSRLALDDHTYTHLSIRPNRANYFYIYPFGLCFNEVTNDVLLKVSLKGEILEGKEYQYNKTGYIIHGSVYEARPDISAIFHLHTPAMVAVSAMKEGLMPLSQWALHFYDRISYHSYDSLALDEFEQGKNIATDLNKNSIMFMRNHGILTCGRTIHEAMFYTYHLEQACKTQIMALSTGQPLILPEKEICQKAVKDLLSFEDDLGKRDWEAWLRLLNK